LHISPTNAYFFSIRTFIKIAVGPENPKFINLINAMLECTTGIISVEGGSNEKVFRLSLHRAVSNPGLGQPLPDHDVIYFASPSGVQAYWQVYGEEAFRRTVWCIGEITLGQLEELGIEGKVVDPDVPLDKTSSE